MKNIKRLFFKNRHSGQKTARQLLKEFDKKYTVDQIEASGELEVLYQFLVRIESKTPDKLINPFIPYNDLLRRHLDYSPKVRKEATN